MLQAIDPDATTDVPVGGGIFKLGPVPAVVWQRVKFEQITAYEQAQRRAIRALAADHLPPDAVISAGNVTISRAKFVANTDPVYQVTLVRLMMELLRYGLRGHEGFVRANGEPVPFNLEKTVVEGTTVEVVAQSTLRYYEVNPSVSAALYAKLAEMCELNPLEKKV